MMANRIEKVLPVLEFAESEARSGSYVAVLLSYEAAPAFDPALITHSPSDFPLAWAAVVPSPLELVPEENPATSANSWTSRVSRDEYNRAVARIRDLIAAGDTYQVNYSFPLNSS